MFEEEGNFQERRLCMLPSDLVESAADQVERPGPTTSTTRRAVAEI